MERPFFDAENAWFQGGCNVQHKTSEAVDLLRSAASLVMMAKTENHRRKNAAYQGTTATLDRDFPW